MNPNFGTVTIVGAGLLGGSLGLALKARGLARTIRGVGRRQCSLDTALAKGAIDENYLNLEEAVHGADLIVVCTPAGMVPQQLDQIRGACSVSAFVTDVASTKAEICAHAEATWTPPRRFVGSHPMAGSEKFGPEHATATLYDGCVTFVEALQSHEPEAHERVVTMWQSVGARVIEVEPVRHDALVARTSHIPHILAALIAELAGDACDVRAEAGRGFRDVTRIAAGRPEIWRDICLTNRAAVLEGLEQIARRLDHVRGAIEAGSGEALEAFFESARAAREKVAGE